MATSRAQVGEPQARSRKGDILTEEGVKALAVGYIRRKLGIVAVKAQCLSLLGRLEGLSPGATSAQGRREALGKREKGSHSLN